MLEFAAVFNSLVHVEQSVHDNDIVKIGEGVQGLSGFQQKYVIKSCSDSEFRKKNCSKIGKSASLSTLVCTS
jgi:hypothetical protein